MKTYKVTWVKHATSFVEAESPEEALAKAEKGQDRDFECGAEEHADPMSGNAGWTADEAEEEEEA